MSANLNNLPRTETEPKRAKCGTTAGYLRHRHQKEPYCEPCKVANAIYMKAYRERKGEELLAKKRAYQQANKAKENARSAAWRMANPERAKLGVSTWVQKYPQRKAEADRIYRRNNAAKLRCQDLEKGRRRRAWKLGNGYEIYTDVQVLETYGSSCHICKLPIDLTLPRSCKVKGWEFGLQIDHVTPISLGGADTLENVRPSHGICNIKKGAKIGYKAS